MVLQEACAKYKSEKPPPTKTASSLFPPKTSSSSQQKDIQSAFRSSQTQRSGNAGSGGIGNPLKCSRPQTFNAVPPKVPSRAPLPTPPNTIQSTISQSSSQKGSQLLKAFNNETAFQENTPAVEISFVSSNMMTNLHEAVYFDENDFDDDLELSLDFNVDEPLISADLRAAVANISPSPNCALPKAQPHEDIPDSSAPLPWSSSPVRHFHSVAAPRRPTGKVFSQEGVSQMKSTTSRTFSTSTSTKASVREEKLIPDERPKRRLPWLPKSVGVPMEEEPIAKKPRAQKLTEEEPNEKRARGRKPRRQSTAEPPETPPQIPNMPWDTTASAAKVILQEFKAKTTGPKRSVTTKIPDPIDKLKKSKQQVARVFLSEEQKRVIDFVESGKSVFFTGAAGTGKSVLLRELILHLRTKYKREIDRVAVTASTGLAACNIGGVTLHSFSGIGLGKEAPADLVKKIKRNAKAKGRWLRTKVLIIDEISMVDGELFDKLEAVARQIKNNGRPFGGIQLVITGDFFQLPPVPDDNRVSKFAFEADTWNTSIDHTIGLRQVFRQRDTAFADMLNEMRLGKLSPKTIDAFKGLDRPLTFDDGIQATELFPTRKEVDTANNDKMRLLAGKIEVFEAADGPSTQDLRMRDKLLSNCMAPQRIELKVNSQVMLIKNIDETLVNGSLGRVVGFMDEQTFDHVKDEGDLDNFVAGIDSDGSFSDGENNLLAKRRERIKEKRAAIAKPSATTSRKWPLVQFVIPDGTTRQLLVQPEQWKVELPNGEIQAQRVQIPLILAWALSIHKAQGQTLERVKVDLGKVFEKGQAYVALSRATCLEGLQVLRFDPKKVMAHDRVRGFYASLYNVLDTEAGSSSASVSMGADVKKISSVQAMVPAPPRVSNAKTQRQAQQSTTKRKKVKNIFESQGEEEYDDFEYQEIGEDEFERSKTQLMSYG